jgi:hypothetical protein
MRVRHDVLAIEEVLTLWLSVLVAKRYLCSFGLSRQSIKLFPHAARTFPAAVAGTFGIFGRARLEETGVFDAVEDFHQSRQRMRSDLLTAHFGNAKMPEQHQQAELG